MNTVEIGKTYRVYAPFGGRLLDEIKVDYIKGTTFHGYSNAFDYETSYDLSDGIRVEEINA